MGIFKKKKKFETCRICGKTDEYEKWNFPIIWDLCRSCTIDGIVWACEQASKQKKETKK